MPYTIKLPKGKIERKRFWKKNKWVVISWVITLAMAVVLFFKIFYPKPLPEKVKDTTAFKTEQRTIDSLQLVIRRANDSIFNQGLYIESIQTELTIQRSTFRMTENELQKVLHKPDFKPVNLSNDSITNWLTRKYGDR